MATYTITTAVNIDSLTAKAGGDTYNINGGYLTIDQDSRYGTNQTTSSTWGPVTLSATLGGTVEINSTKVRLIPYDTGSGNVPALGTTISKGSASGILLGVYDTLAVAPTAVGVAMPANGFIKIRQWNSVAYSSGALTGIGASATGVDVPGWLEIVGDEAGLCTVNRLALFKVQGDYFELGTTDGTRATTYQIPSHGTLQYHAGVEVETGTGTGIYEFYPCAGTRTALLANLATDEFRSKLCWVSTAGLLRFGHDGTNSTGGYIPPAGRKIRMFNIFFANCTTAARTANVAPNTTLATRYEFSVAGGGVMEMDKANVGWYMNLNQGYSLDLTNIAVLDSIVMTEIATPIAFDNVHVGMSQATEFTSFLASLNFAGGTISNCKWVRAAQAASGNVSSFTDCSDFTFSNVTLKSLTRAGSATGTSLSLTRCTGFTLNDTTLAGSRLLLTTCTNTAINDTIYYDHPATNTGTANSYFAFDMATNCLNTTIDGLTFPVAYNQPYSGILQIGAAGCANTTLRNLGTYASPLDLGGAYQENKSWSRTTTVMTITSVAHGLIVGNLIAYNITSDTAPNAVTTTTATLEAVASIPTADTFTITVGNSGGTSGTCSYYPCVSGTLVSIAASAAANTVRVQRCYTPHLRGNIIGGDNSSKNIQYDSVFGTNWGISVLPELNANMRMVNETPPLTAQTSCYGTHFLDYYTAGIPTNTSGVSWTRSTTTATITSTGHNFRTGDLINVTVTSSGTAIVLGQKTITATTSNAFTFTCLNAGDASGTLTFKPLHGRFAVLMNEPTADTSTQVTLANGAAFTSAGGLYMPVIGHSAIFETPYYVLGHLNFPIAQAVMAGGTIGNYDTQYALDTGSGFSSYKNLHYPRAGGGGSISSTNVTMTSTTGVAAGDYVFGTNIAPNAKVVSITNSTTVVVDIANIGTVSGVLIFNQLPSEADLPISGAKIRVKITTSTTNATAITSLYFFMQSNATTRAAQYPLSTVSLSITAKDATDLSVIEGARVLLEADTGGPLPANESVTVTRSGSTASVTHTAHGMSAGASVIIRGAIEDEYNGVYQITNVTTNAYDYTVTGSPSTPATGTITATAQILSGLTNASGILSTDSFEFTSTQPVTGKIRKGSASTFYKTSTIIGTITSSGLDSTILLIPDE